MSVFQKGTIAKHHIKILWGFLAISIAIVVLIVYFSFSGTTIHITPKLFEVNTDISIPLISAQQEPAENAEQTNASKPLPGILLEHTLSSSKTTTDLTSTAKKLDKATGELTIMNHYSADQPLVATTRLLSKEGVLFRTSQTVTVPAGGKVRVRVAADKGGATGEIGPSRFTIVALWGGLQDKIYAESDKPMSREGKPVTIASASDIRNLQDALLSEMKTEAVEKLKHDAKVQYPHLNFFEGSVTPAVLSETSSVPANTEVSELTVETKLQVIAFLSDSDILTERVLEILSSSLLENMKLKNQGVPSMEYHLESIDLSQQTAQLVGKARHKASITLQHPIIDRSQILNKDEQDIRAYFTSFEEIEAVTVDFSPFWVRRAPALADHIEIILEKPLE